MLEHRTDGKENDMGVYIPNMEKPKECIECEFSCLWVNGSTHCMVDGEELFCDGIPQRHDCPLIDIVTCKECKWYDPPHIKYNDGTRKDVEEDELWVTSDVGINCGGKCIYHIGLKIYCDAHDREDPEDKPNIIIFRKPDDFCSYGERRTDE